MNKITAFLSSEKAVLYSLMILAFSISLHKRMLVPVMAMFLLLVFFRFRMASFLKNINQHKSLLLLVAYYVLSVVSLLWTENIEEGLFDIEVKFSFLVFPLVFLMLPQNFLTKDRLNAIARAYIAGVFLAVIICLVSAIIAYLNEPVFYYTFISSSLSVLHHPTYFSMFINLAIIMILHRYYIEKNHSAFTIVSVLILLLFNWLLMSRSGLVTSVLIVFVFWLVMIFQKRFKVVFTMLVMFIVATIIIFSFSSYTLTRMSSLLPFVSGMLQNSETPAQQQDARFITWEAAMHSIRQNPWFGTGAGDMHQALNEYYLRHNFIEGYKKQLNAHNQFLQTWMSVGIVGVLIIAGMYVAALYRYLKMKLIVPVGFLVIIFLAMLTESIFETQSGIVFFCFFYNLFFLQQPEGLETMKY